MSQSIAASSHQLPETGFLRVSQIVGDPNSKPPKPAIIPVSKSGWWSGCKSGKYPAPLKLSEGVTVWRVEDIKKYIASV